MVSFQAATTRAEPRLPLRLAIDESSQWRHFHLRDDLMTAVAYYGELCLLLILRRKTYSPKLINLRKKYAPHNSKQ